MKFREFKFVIGRYFVARRAGENHKTAMTSAATSLILFRIRGY